MNKKVLKTWMSVYRMVSCLVLFFLLIQMLFVSSTYAEEASSSAEVLSDALPDGKGEILDEAAMSSLEDVQDEFVEALPDLETDVMGVSASVYEPPKIRGVLKKVYQAKEKVIARVDNARGVGVEVKLKNDKGDEVYTEIDEIIQDRSKIYALVPPARFEPGVYSLEIETDSGEKSEQDFTWGVLAFNPDKSLYEVGEKARLSMAVLEAQGAMVCDAELTLHIVDPENVEHELSTENGEVVRNDSCSVHDFTLEPDYESSFNIEYVGEYRVTLSAETEAGEFVITDSFEASDEVVFSVARSVYPTRIYPLREYPVEITVQAHEDFVGRIVEAVPVDFEISENKKDGVLAYDKVFSASSLRVHLENEIGGEVRLGKPFEEKMNIAGTFGDVHEDPALAEKYAEHGVAGHDGVDFDMRVGSSVLATDTGTVVLAEEEHDYGTTVVIQHAWGKSYYGHLSEILVEKGDEVVEGDEIAKSGNSGLSSAPHLHFGVKPEKYNVYNGYFGKIDPLPHMGVDVSTYDERKAKKDVILITWEVDLKKGDEVVLGYTFDAPDVSPQFYNTGPLRFFEEDTIVFEEERRWQIASDDIGSQEVDPNGDQATGWNCTAGTDGNCVTGHYTVVDDGSGSPSTSGYIHTGTAGSGGEIEEFQMETFTPPGTLNSVDNVTVYVYAQSATNANGGQLDDIEIDIFMGGGYVGPITRTPAYNTWAWTTGASFDGTWDQNDLDNLRVEITRIRQGTGSPGDRDDDVQIAAVYADVTYDFTQSSAALDELMRHGKWFNSSGAEQPFSF